MDGIIFYFSGTGNSYHIARTIADRLGMACRPIVSLKKGDVVENDRLCFVFPVYDFKPPKRVTDIIMGLSGIKADHISAVGTYGVALSSAMYHFNKTLREKGAVLSLGYGIKMPHNAVGSAWISEEENATRLRKADGKVLNITENIRAGAAGHIERTSLWEGAFLLKRLPKILKFLFSLIFKGSESMSFTVSEDCVGCGQCSRICPNRNIEMADGKPVFGSDCGSCFACLQWCPSSAIQFGRYGFEELCMKHYHHPEVKAEDLTRPLS